MKYEWKKNDKSLYLPKQEPIVLVVPPINYFIIDGKGNPNNEEFSKVVETLYSLSYTIKMMPKKGEIPKGYYEYTVFPLEGKWDMQVDSNTNFDKLDKDKFIYSMMIRQPDFVDETLAKKAVEIVKKKKLNDFIDKAKFQTMKGGLCVQIMHIGSYDNEIESFNKIDMFCKDNGYRRIGHTHKEIYLTDPRKTKPDKLRTVLRVRVEKI